MVTDNTNLMLEKWGVKMLYNYDSKSKDTMVMVNTDYEDEVQGTNSINLNTMGSVSFSTGLSIVHSSPSISLANFTVDQFHNVSVPISKVDLERIKNHNLKNLWNQRILQAADDIRANRILSLYTDAGITVSGGAQTKNTIVDLFSKCMEKLRDAKAVDGQGKAIGSGNMPWAMTNAPIGGLIDTSPDLKTGTGYQEMILKDGITKVKTLKGFRILYDDRFTAVGGTYYMMFGTDDAITYASQINITREMQDANDYNVYLQMLIGYMAEVVNPNSLGYASLTI